MSSAPSLAASQFTSCALGPGSAAGFRADLFFTDFFGDFTAGLSATVPRGEGPRVKDPLTYTLASGIDEPCVWVDPTTYGVAYPSISYPSEAVFTCPFQYDKGDSGCVKTYEQSPFDSIPTSFWWCLVTMTTVGYGDVVPTSGFGQFIGGIVMIFGIVVIALPITVIGSNFATIYKTHVTNETLTEGTFFIP